MVLIIPLFLVIVIVSNIAITITTNNNTYIKEQVNHLKYMKKLNDLENKIILCKANKECKNNEDVLKLSKSFQLNQ